jgi:ketosteroid isomerase-like protein
MRYTGRITLLAVGSLLLSGCSKSTPATADSATASSTATTSFDEKAASAQILANDSAFVRGMLTKHVDSVMMYYDPDVVSLGTKVIKGTADLQKSYAEAVKSNPRDVTFQSGGVKFSNDHSMAWDYGTVTQTVDGPKGKPPVKSSGTYLNVWKNVGGRWMIVAEISNLSP